MTVWKAFIKHKVSEDGIKDLFQWHGGNVISNDHLNFRDKTFLTRDVPSYGFYIIAYEWLFDNVCDRKSGELPSPFQTVWVGGVAG